ncbi:hypothetical protein [Cytobacillus sp. IB215665]|uniref:hypothetical protein n=1 Tax=Cytobacillus sp. IB215665 TaxID=3097357 RepID=UPI002A0F627B|nr:hypothetical protein [Cytobacillus sp. IB215665]MDX8367109.1 hypothetical protein [Cytobacillus sp. IB215665]
MNSETYIDFCFVRKSTGNFIAVVEPMLTELFNEVNLNWYLEEKNEQGIDIVVAEVKGMSRWKSEEETIHYIEDHARDQFWEYLQGYKIYIYPPKKGCSTCGTR